MMPSEPLTADEIDELKEGDVLAPARVELAAQTRRTVLETDVIDEMRVDGERKLTAGVKVQDGKTTRLISYETLADRGFVVYRDWADLTTAQAEKVRERA